MNLTKPDSSFFFTTRMSALKLCHKIRVTIYRTKIPLTSDVRFCVFCQTSQRCDENRPSVAIDCTKQKANICILIYVKFKNSYLTIFVNYKECAGNNWDWVLYILSYFRPMLFSHFYTCKQFCPVFNLPRRSYVNREIIFNI